MIEKEQLQELTLPQLIAIDEQLTAYIFKQTKGEPVHPDYKRNRKAYSQLIKETVRLERTVRKFRKGQAERIASLVHIHRIKAQEDGEEYMNDDAWGAEDSALANDLADSIYPVFDLGAETTAQEIGVGTAVSSDTSPQSKFLNQYIVTLAGNLNKTTKADITQAVKTSLQLGENRDELTARIDDILNDTNRSEMIAQTESIRAYAQGRLAVGRELNFDSKQWRWPGNSTCPVCPALEEMGPINIDDTFDTGSDSLGEVDGPPAHPWCQCSVKLLNQQDDNVEGSEAVKAGWITKEGQHVFIPGAEDRNKTEQKMIEKYGVGENASNGGFITTDGKVIPLNTSHSDMTKSIRQVDLQRYLVTSNNVRLVTNTSTIFLHVAGMPTLPQLDIIKNLSADKSIIYDLTVGKDGGIKKSGENNFKEFRNDLYAVYRNKEVSTKETLNSIKAGWITKDGHHIFLPDGEGESHTEHFQKTPYSTNKISEFTLHDAEHQIKYNGALQAAYDTKNDAVKELIYKADVTNANDPTEMAGMILHSLPTEFQNNRGVKDALMNWGKSAQRIYNESLRKGKMTEYTTSTAASDIIR